MSLKSFMLSLSTFLCRIGFHANELINERVQGSTVTSLIEHEDGSTNTERKRLSSYMRTWTRCKRCKRVQIIAITETTPPPQPCWSTKGPHPWDRETP